MAHESERISMVNQEAGLDTILVPLDGSELAERALPAAQRIAQATGAPLLLARIVTITHWNSLSSGYLLAPHIYEEILRNEEQAAGEYLDRKAQEARDAGIAVTTKVMRGDPASILIDMEPELHIGLVVMASHGRTGLARFALGSVAARVVRGGQAPVLLIRPFGDAARQTRLEKALVPLDGSALAELALDMVRHLAGAIARQVTLVRVVDPDLLTGETDEAKRYLDEARTRLVADLGERPCTVSTSILYGRAAEQILEASDKDDLIVMATHGHAGVTRWAFGSVADRVLHHAQVPLLLVRPHTPR